jgi:hypothetical protein
MRTANITWHIEFWRVNCFIKRILENRIMADFLDIGG